MFLWKAAGRDGSPGDRSTFEEIAWASRGTCRPPRCVSLKPLEVMDRRFYAEVAWAARE